MASKSKIDTVIALATRGSGLVRVDAVLEAGLSHKEVGTIRRNGLLVPVLPGVCKIGSVTTDADLMIRAAVLWAGPSAVVVGTSAASWYRLDGVGDPKPMIAVPPSVRKRHPAVRVVRCGDRSSLMVRRERGLPVSGVEATLCMLGGIVSEETLEIACEDARRRQRTTVSALRAYLERFGRSGVPGVGALRGLVRELDPVHPSNSVLEVRTRRLLRANGLGDHVREFPMEWNGRRYRFDFCFPAQRVILETNGRRWHDDVADYEFDQEKWSVPARHGYRIVFATWAKVCDRPRQLLAELQSALAGGGVAA